MSTEIYLPQATNAVITGHHSSINKNMSWGASEKKSTDEYPAERQSYYVSSWCVSGMKRVFDLICVVPALILILPLLGIIAIAVRISSPGPIIFRQQRAGRYRKLFTIYKFRTMVENSEATGPDHTAKGDPRITKVGKFLRQFKLDELPQLYNVLRGEMSLVGPRPKLPDHDLTLTICRPGVTGAATLAFRREQHILCEVPIERMEDFYREHVAPCKIKLDADYMRQANLWTDISVLLATAFSTGDYLTLHDLVIFSSKSVSIQKSQSRISLKTIKS